MSRRTDRIANLIRNTLGELMLTRMSDPRFDPARASITHVEVPEDLLSAKVYVSVVGEPADQRKALQALRHAAGHMQKEMMNRIQLRNTPVLNFVLDENFKKTLQTLQLIQQAMDEIKHNDELRQGQTPDAPPEAEDDEPTTESPPQ
jgi:ribosome-binding factor A